MLKKTIKFEDYDGNERSQDFWFHLSKPNIIALEANYEGGVTNYINKISNTQDQKALVELFKDFIYMTCGEKSPDGMLFDQSDEAKKRFIYSPAYEELYMELATDADAAAKFINGVIPRNLAEQIKEAAKEGKLTEEQVKVVNQMNA